MADIDRSRFGRAVAQRLLDEGLSYRDACRVWPDLNTALISRAVNGAVLSAANMLLVCNLLDIDPFAFLLRDARPVGGRRLPKYKPKQAVTASSRETLVGIGAIVDRWSSSPRLRKDSGC